MLCLETEKTDWEMDIYSNSSYLISVENEERNYHREIEIDKIDNSKRSIFASSFFHPNRTK